MNVKQRDKPCGGLTQCWQTSQPPITSQVPSAFSEAPLRHVTYLVDVGGGPAHHALIKAIPVERDLPLHLQGCSKTAPQKPLLS